MIKLTLCKDGCCPTVETKEGNVIIQDDFGGRVSLTQEQLEILVTKYPEIKAEL